LFVQRLTYIAPLSRFAQYVSWADGNSTIPYPPSWIPDPVSNYSNGSYNVFYDYAYRFYADEAVATTVDRMFKEHIDTILTRRNTVNGKFYKEDPVVMGMTWINLR
jgi:mannan endo-1,4-beta-mannosidase